MYTSEAENMVRRVLEEHPEVQMSEQQVSVMAKIVLKIAGRMIEEALSQWRPSSGGKPSFFS